MEKDNRGQKNPKNNKYVKKRLDRKGDQEKKQHSERKGYSGPTRSSNNNELVAASAHIAMQQAEGVLDAAKEILEGSIATGIPPVVIVETPKVPEHHTNWEDCLKRMKSFNFTIHNRTHLASYGAIAVSIQAISSLTNLSCVRSAMESSFRAVFRFIIGDTADRAMRPITSLLFAPKISAILWSGIGFAVSVKIGIYLTHQIEKVTGENSLSIKLSSEHFDVREPLDEIARDLRPHAIASGKLLYEAAKCRFDYTKKVGPTWLPMFSWNSAHTGLSASYELVAQLQTLKSTSLLIDVDDMFERIHMTAERLHCVNQNKYDFQSKSVAHGSALLAWGIYRRRLEDLEFVNFPRPKRSSP